MDKEKLNKIKTFLTIMTTSIVIATALFAIERHFAKSEEVIELKDIVNLTNERIDISIIDDQIFQQQQSIQRVKDLPVFERKEDAKLTPAEKEILEREEKELMELEKKRERKIKEYEAKR